MNVTLSGMSTEVKEEQPLNVPATIRVIFLGMLIEVKEEQPKMHHQGIQHYQEC